MTGRERLLAVLARKPVDRAPIWLRDQFNYGGRFPLRREPTFDVCMLDPFADGWVERDPAMQEIRSLQQELGPDIIKEFVVPGKVCNRLLCTQPSRIRLIEESYAAGKHRTTYALDTPRGTLTTTTVCEKNVSTMWQEKYLVEDEMDLEKLLSVPFELDPIEKNQYDRERELLADDGIMMMQIDTPMITVSGLMKFEDFLMMQAEDPERMKQLCDLAFERVYAVVEQLLRQGMGDLFRLNGSEQATPPMNSPKVYEQLVYPYEKKLAALIHSYGKFVAVHSHGKVSHSLPLMVDAGIDMVDPIEAPPAGDIGFLQARALTEKKIVLAGNLQFSEMEYRGTDYVQACVREIFSDGSDRIVLNATASPITFMQEQLKQNYLAMLRYGVQYGSGGGSR